MRSIFIAFLIVTISQSSLLAQSANEGSPDVPGDLIVNFGFNFLQDQVSDMDLSFIGSRSLGLYYTNRIEISPRFSFYPAIGLGFEKYSFSNDVTLSRDSVGSIVLQDIRESLADGINAADITSNVTAADLSDFQIARNRLAVTYLEVPLELRFYPKGTSDGSGLFIGFGASIGLRLESHTKFRVEPPSGEDITTEKLRSNFDLNRLRYGLIGRVGTRGINGFYRIYLSELFEDGRGPEGSAPSTFTVGLGFNAF